MYIVGVGEVVDLELLGQGRVGQNDDLVAGQDIVRESLFGQHVYRHVTVEFADARQCRLVSGLSDIRLS